MIKSIHKINSKRNFLLNLHNKILCSNQKSNVNLFVRIIIIY